MSQAAPKQTQVPLLDVNRGNQALHAEIMEAIESVVTSGRFLHGPDGRLLGWFLDRLRLGAGHG